MCCEIRILCICIIHYLCNILTDINMCNNLLALQIIYIFICILFYSVECISPIFYTLIFFYVKLQANFFYVKLQANIYFMFKNVFKYYFNMKTSFYIEFYT